HRSGGPGNGGARGGRDCSRSLSELGAVGIHWGSGAGFDWRLDASICPGEPAGRFRFLPATAGCDVSKRLGLLFGGTLAFWLLVVYPARVWSGWPGVVHSAVAMSICLAPTAVTLVWARRAALQSPAQQLLAVMG